MDKDGWADFIEGERIGPKEGVCEFRELVSSGVKIDRGGLVTNDSRSGTLVERFEHGLGYKAACACHWVMRLIPRTTLKDLANDIEEVALLKRELLGGRGTIATCRANDLLRRGHGGRGLGDWW